MNQTIQSAMKVSRESRPVLDFLKEVFAAEDAIAQMSDSEMSELRQQMARKPGDGFLYYWHGLALAARGHHSEACDELMRASKSGCTHWRVGWRLAQYAKAAGRMELVEDACSAVLEAKTAETKESDSHQKWFAVHEANWRNYLLPWAKGRGPLNVLEIGSYEGTSACWILKHLLTDAHSHLTCVDAWSADVGHGTPSEDMERTYATFLKNITETGKAGQLTVLRGDSKEMLKPLPEESFHLIYVDGDHSADGVYADTLAAHRLVKQDGVILWDDYYWSDSVKEGVDRACAELGIQVRCLGNNAVWMKPVAGVKPPKIVGLIPVRNEAARIGFCLQALAQYTDSIVILDDCSEDDTVAIVESLAKECHVEKIIRKTKWQLDEPGDRNALLQAGREIGGTHFIALDADEALTSNCQKGSILRRMIFKLQPGDVLMMNWIQLWRGVGQYRFDQSHWSWNYKGFVFCDDGKACHSSEYVHTCRFPSNLSGRVYTLRGYEHGVMHFQFVHWRNMLVKQAWYRCLEHIREPQKPIEDINARYAPSKNEKNLGLMTSPAEWFSNYPFFKPEILNAPESWREAQVLDWFKQYGKEHFKDLDIWDINWGNSDPVEHRVPTCAKTALHLSPEAKHKLEEADNHFARKNFESARQSLSEAVKLAPEEPDLWVAMANLHFQLQNLPESRDALVRATTLRPNDVTLLVMLAGIYFRLAQIEDFERVLAHALKINPDSSDALKLLADLNIQNGRYPVAAKIYFRLLQKNKNNVEVILPLGVCFYKIGDLSTAREMFEHVLNIQPENTLARENLQAVIQAADKAAQQNQAKQESRPIPGPAHLPKPAGKAPLREYKTPIVTAIVTTYNAERFIRGCIEDLESQTIADRLEIIVVDSASPQNERMLVEALQKKYPNITYIRTPHRETVYGAWNRAIRMAQGKYITNANTDDRHRADALEILARTLDERPDISLVYADCLVTKTENETFASAHATGSYQWLDFDPAAFITKGCFVGPQPMWRREAHEEHGYFDAAFVSAGDFEFWMRMARTRKFLHVKETLGLYLESPTSVEHANRDRAAIECRTAQERHQEALLKISPNGPSVPAKHITIDLPPAGFIGRLKFAADLFNQKKLKEAWGSALEALRQRPFHPEAYLMLADIALAAGDQRQARRCVERAQKLAPHWNAAKNYFKTAAPAGKFQAIQWPPLPEEGHRLSVCMIVKNEENFLAQCLKSVGSIAHQIVVVDTGSTDRTVEVAREHGAEVYSHPWNDDFSAARNVSLEHATGDWILILDADEELEEGAQAQLMEDMRASDMIAYRIPLVNIGHDSEGADYVPRLFRNAPGVFFYGRIHEQVFPSLVVRGAEWGLNKGLGKTKLLHHGYTAEVVQNRQKIDRNLRLLKQAVIEQPNEPNLIMNLGLELVRSGQLGEGLAQLREACRLMSRQPAHLVVPELREVLLTRFSSFLFRAKEYNELIEVLNSPLARQAELTATLHSHMGLSLFKLKKYQEAAQQMRLCLDSRHKPTLTPVHHDILKSGPRHCLAVCLMELKEYEDAGREFVAAMGEESTSRGLRLDYARFLAVQNQPVEALKFLHALVEEKVDDPAPWALGGWVALRNVDMLSFAREWIGAAIKQCPSHNGIIALWAETLLFSGKIEESLDYWKRVAPEYPEQQAAIVIGEIIAGTCTRHFADVDEKAVSRELIQWYRRLLAFKANPVVSALNKKMGQVKAVAPTAGAMLETALLEANQDEHKIEAMAM